MQAVTRQVLREVPGATLSQDSAGRETDIAIDHSEFTQLSAEDIARVMALMQDAGMTATVSSIHINGWFGEHNKLEGARWIVRKLFDRDLDAELSRWVYVGDSSNDQLMFEYFPHSAGVANICRFEAQLTHKPRYLAQAARGAGFAEVARAILRAQV
jgi:HAD superfamily hydrolase (TIGR01484 family)